MPMCHPSRIALLTGRYPFRDARPLGDPARVRGHLRPRPAERRLRDRAGREVADGAPAQRPRTTWPSPASRPAPPGAGTRAPCYQNAVIYVDGVVRPDLAERYSPDVHTDFLIDFMAEPRSGPFLAYYPMNLPHLSAVAADDATLPQLPRARGRDGSPGRPRARRAREPGQAPRHARALPRRQRHAGRRRLEARRARDRRRQVAAQRRGHPRAAARELARRRAGGRGLPRPGRRLRLPADPGRDRGRRAAGRSRARRPQLRAAAPRAPRATRASGSTAAGPAARSCATTPGS